MNYNELKKRIEADGWKLERSGKGSHRIFKHPVKKGVLSIPDHGAKDLGKGLVNALLKEAGLK